MKQVMIVVAAAILSAAIVWPDKVRATVEDTMEFFLKKDNMEQPLSRGQAVKTILMSPDAVVYRCYQVELTDKLTLIKKKSK